MASGEFNFSAEITLPKQRWVSVFGWTHVCFQLWKGSGFAGDCVQIKYV